MDCGLDRWERSKRASGNAAAPHEGDVTRDADDSAVSVHAGRRPPWGAARHGDHCFPCSGIDPAMNDCHAPPSHWFLGVKGGWRKKEKKKRRDKKKKEEKSPRHVGTLRRDAFPSTSGRGVNVFRRHYNKNKNNNI